MLKIIILKKKDTELYYNFILPNGHLPSLGFRTSNFLVAGSVERSFESEMRHGKERLRERDQTWTYPSRMYNAMKKVEPGRQLSVRQ